MKAERLLAHYERIADAPDAIARLRRFILDLAVRGKLVPQNREDEPATELLKRIEEQRAKAWRAKSVKKSASNDATIIRNIPFELPSNWAWSTLGEILHYDAGIKKGPKELLSTYWLLELEDIEKDTGRLLERVSVSRRSSQSTKSEFQAGDILYGKLPPYLTKVLVADAPGYSTTEIVSIRPYVPMSADYCALALRRPDFVEYVTRLGQGTKMPRLRTEDAVAAPFPLPPIAEQHRIVAKVDELMALCNQLEKSRTAREETRDRLTAASLSRLNDPASETFQPDARFALDALPSMTARPDQIKQLRQTILNLAVRGKLLPQDSNDEPASKLLKRIKHEKALQAAKGSSARTSLSNEEDRSAGDDLGLPATWVPVTVADVGYLRSGVPLAHGEEKDTGPIPYVKVADLSLPQNSKGITTSSRFIGAGRDSDAFAIGSIVFPKRGGAIATNRKRRALVKIVGDSNLMAMKSYLDEVEPYLQLWFSSFDLWVLNSGTSVPQINNKDIYPLSLGLPPLAEQKRIVAKVDELMALCDRMEASLATGEMARSRLLEALLHEALEPTVDQLEVAA